VLNGGYKVSKSLITCFIRRFGTEGSTYRFVAAGCGALVCNGPYFDRRGVAVTVVIVICAVDNVAVDAVAVFIFGHIIHLPI